MTSFENRCSRTVVLASSVIGEKPSSLLTQLVASALWNTPGAQVLTEKYVRDAFVSFEVQPQVYEFERVDTARLPEPSEVLTDVLSTDIAPSPKHFEYSFPNAGSSIPKSYHSLIEYVDKNYPRQSTLDEKEKTRILVKASIFRYRREREQSHPAYERIISTSTHAPLQLLSKASTVKEEIKVALDDLKKYTAQFENSSLDQFKNLSNQMIGFSTPIISDCSSNDGLVTNLEKNLETFQCLQVLNTTSLDVPRLRLSLKNWTSQRTELLDAFDQLRKAVDVSVSELDKTLTHLITLPDVTSADPYSGLASAKYNPFKNALDKFAYPLWSYATTGTPLTRVITEVKTTTTNLLVSLTAALTSLQNPQTPPFQALKTQINEMKNFATLFETSIGLFEIKFTEWEKERDLYSKAYEEMNKVAQALHDLAGHDFEEGYSLLHNWCDVADLYWEWAIKMIEQKSWIVDSDLERKIRLLAFVAFLAARIDNSAAIGEYPSQLVLNQICRRAVYTLKKIDDLLKFKSVRHEGLLERVLKDAISIYKNSVEVDDLKFLNSIRLGNLNKQFDKESEPLLK